MLPRRALLALLGLSLVGCGSDDRAAEPTGPAACVPAPPSASDPWAVERDPASAEIALARRVADRWLAVHSPEDSPWDWGAGTLMLALADLYRVTGDTRYRDYYRAYADHWLGGTYQVVNSDSCPSSHAAMNVYRESCDEAYLPPVEGVLAYLETAPRADSGGIQHLGAFELLGRSIWVDSLQMFGSVWTRWAELTRDRAVLARHGEQIGIFVRELQDAGGLFRHAKDFALAHDTDIYWARGNGWVTASTYDYLRVARALGVEDAVARDAMARQVQAILASQDPATGLFWTLMNRPGEIYLETSATALFALGMARGVRLGLLGADARVAIARAMDGVRTRIVDDPEGRALVTDISGPTTAGDADDYAEVALEQDLDFGVGAVILALIETSGLPG